MLHTSDATSRALPILYPPLHPRDSGTLISCPSVFKFECRDAHWEGYLPHPGAPVLFYRAPCPCNSQEGTLPATNDSLVVINAGGGINSAIVYGAVQPSRFVLRLVIAEGPDRVPSRGGQVLAAGGARSGGL